MSQFHHPGSPLTIFCFDLLLLKEILVGGQSLRFRPIASDLSVPGLGYAHAIAFYVLLKTCCVEKPQRGTPPVLPIFLLALVQWSTPLLSLVVVRRRMQLLLYF